ncbi:hypothetical protein [Dehalobacterium formicoaceticum]|uniref:hypothetical protein n=1 Tax=Dehalobacterium formicoaceticum TaxID=51515 RepID=UPI000B7CBEA0|nr:hypothetical protein [Dehalobacterium formicoaceticum]
MLEKAINKIKSEMDIDKNKNNVFMQTVGNFLLRYLESNPGAAENIMQNDKTLAMSMGAMRAEAKKHKHGDFAVLTDQEGFAVVLKYYNINGTPVQATSAIIAPAPEPVKEDTSFNIRLEDLL